MTFANSDFCTLAIRPTVCRINQKLNKVFLSPLINSPFSVDRFLYNSLSVAFATMLRIFATCPKVTLVPLLLLVASISFCKSFLPSLLAYLTRPDKLRVASFQLLLMVLFNITLSLFTTAFFVLTTAFFTELVLIELLII